LEGNIKIDHALRALNILCIENGDVGSHDSHDFFLVYRVMQMRLVPFQKYKRSCGGAEVVRNGVGLQSSSGAEVRC
jgi:hypothetical protein